MIIHMLEGFAVVCTIVIVSLFAALLLATLLRSASASSQVTEEFKRMKGYHGSIRGSD